MHTHTAGAQPTRPNAQTILLQTTPPQYTQTFIPTTREVARALVYVFRLVPAYALGNGLVNLVFKVR